MIRYEIRRHSAEIVIRTSRDLAVIRPGCTASDPEPELIAVHPSEVAARAALARLVGSIDIKDSYYRHQLAHVTEYALECVEADEDGEYLNTLWEDYFSLPDELTYGDTTYRYSLRYGWMPAEEEDENND